MIAIMSKFVLDLFESGQPISFEAGRAVFRAGDRVRQMYVVHTGDVDLVRFSRTGARLILHSVGAGAVLAEASAYSATYHCDGLARTAVTATALPVSVFVQRIHASPDAAQSWAAALARELQKSRMQCEIRSLNKVAERLDAWLGENGDLPPRGQIQDLAHRLGVTREALYRELARRRG